LIAVAVNTSCTKYEENQLKYSGTTVQRFRQAGFMTLRNSEKPCLWG
jgi:hypothetical protein